MNKVKNLALGALVAASSLGAKAQTKDIFFVKNDSIHFVAKNMKNINIDYLTEDKYIHYLQDSAKNTKSRTISVPFTETGFKRLINFMENRIEYSRTQLDNTTKASRKFIKSLGLSKPVALLEKIEKEMAHIDEMQSKSKELIGIEDNPIEKNSELFLNKDGDSISLVLPNIPMAESPRPLHQYVKLLVDNPSVDSDTLKFSMNEKGIEGLTEHLKSKQAALSEQSKIATEEGALFDGSSFAQSLNYLRINNTQINKARVFDETMIRNRQIKSKAGNKVK